MRFFSITNDNVVSELNDIAALGTSNAGRKQAEQEGEANEQATELNEFRV
ncbi:hypothetical protein ACPOL_4443 [Acidisarcina polymorpha]|uniref:Uncharacterized protein n=1 Tax=Acidisarcina polymorpha TaxID=2211140 RepID=A0A2Z5G593_9BACT|nr:hypothetical protein ACPOL_4443 [Acidisarcina polymorpha]